MIGTIVIPETMTRFECNQKGCCCKGWTIPFRLPDLARLSTAFEEPERTERLGEAVRLLERPDDPEPKIVLAPTGDDHRCMFLEAEGTCEVHRRFDVAPLPRLCVNFPAVPYGIDTQTEMYFSPICPEVLERIAEGDAPYETAVLDATDGQVQAWAARAVTRCAVSIGGVRLSWETTSAVRKTIPRAVNDPARPVLEVLADVSYALAAVDWDEDLTGFQISEQPDRSAFCGFFSRSVWSHDATLLARNMWDYRRFEFDLPVHDQSYMAGLAVALPQWEAPYRAHRYFTVFSSGAQTMSFFYGSIVHAFALSCRYMAGLCGALNRPADVPVVKAVLRASEYLHRQMERAMPAEAMPWFDLEST